LRCAVVAVTGDDPLAATAEELLRGGLDDVII